MRLDICDYEGCPEKVDPENAETKSMRFCTRHLRELNEIIDAEDVAGILRFWIRASDESRNLAHSMTHDPAGVYRSHKLAEKK
jgi:hypothetical protein